MTPNEHPDDEPGSNALIAADALAAIASLITTLITVLDVYLPKSLSNLRVDVGRSNTQLRPSSSPGKLPVVAKYGLSQLTMPSMLRTVALIFIILLSLGQEADAAPPKQILAIVDTDIGSDIDDAFALALVMKSPELKLLGVTTVSANADARARLAAKLLWEAGGQWRRVPVAAGAFSNTMPLPMEQTHWADGFTSPQLLKVDAGEFLRSQINRYPGQITLVAIGPLTNIGNLIRADPSAAKKIKRIVLMGGSIARGYDASSKPSAEYNIRANSKAAQLVFASGIPITMAPLDVTDMLSLDASKRDRIFSEDQPAGSSLAALYKLWGRDKPVLFDAMPVAMIVDPGVCETQKLAIEVDDKGFTRVVQGKAPNATVGMHVVPATFFNFYLNRVARR